jgi:uncharacterized protein YerC
MKRINTPKILLDKDISNVDMRMTAAQLLQFGSTLIQVKSATGLSVPTIIALTVPYQSGGISALQSRKISRPPLKS